MIIQTKIRVGMAPTELSGVAGEIGLIVVNTRYVAQMDDVCDGTTRCTNFIVTRHRRSIG